LTIMLSPLFKKNQWLQIFLKKLHGRISLILYVYTHGALVQRP
jgi:hypothetical protein